MSAAPAMRAEQPRSTFKPVRASKTRRSQAAKAARRHLSRYETHLVGQTKAEQAVRAADAVAHREAAVRSLLWARAMIEQALWLETSGALGTEHATPSSTIRTTDNRRNN